MKKLFTKIVGISLGIAMAVGVGVGISSNSKGFKRVDAADNDTQYSLINSVGDLEASKSYIITNGTSGTVKAIAITSNANNRRTTEVTVSNNKITRGSTVMSFTLGGTSGAWTFATENYAGTAGYLASAASGNNNYLRVIEDANTATISFSGDAAVINIGPHSTRKIVRYNTSDLFACYSTGQQPVYLWKEVSSSGEDPETYYTVNFNTGEGGSSVASQNISDDGTGKASRPASNPTRKGYTFVDWFEDPDADPNNDDPYDFNTVVSGDLTIYAVWEKIAITNTYSASALTNGNTYRIVGEVTAIISTNGFFIQDGNNSMQIYDGSLRSLVSVGNSIEVCGTYNSSYAEITDLAYHDFISHDTTNSQTPLTSLNDATIANRNRYFEIPKIQLASGFTSNSNKQASIKNSDVVVYYTNADYVNGGAFNYANYAENDYVSVAGVIVVYNTTVELQIISINKLSQYTVSFNANGEGVNSLPASQTVLAGDKAEEPADPTRNSDENYSYTFDGWYTNAECTVAYDFDTPVNTNVPLFAKWNQTELIAKQVIENNLTTLSSLTYDYTRNENVITDTLDREFTEKEGTSYGEDWTDKNGTSGAVYSGNSAGGNDSIQLRSSNSSGIVTTSSTNSCKKIIINWNTVNTVATRTVGIYGKNTSYSAASDLYNNSNKGTLLAELNIDDAVNGKSEYTLTSSYTNIGIRSQSGALYITSIEIQWNTVTFGFTNLAIRFGGFMTKTLWDKLDTNLHVIQEYGVIIADTSELSGLTIKEWYDDATDSNNSVEERLIELCGSEPGDTDFRRYKSTSASPVAATTEQKEAMGVDPSGDYYIWTLRKKVSSGNFKKPYTAVAYIKIDGDIVFLQETTASAKTLAVSTVASMNNAAPAYESLNKLAIKETLP